jgi:hypothetical protein
MVVVKDDKDEERDDQRLHTVRLLEDERVVLQRSTQTTSLFLAERLERSEANLINKNKKTASRQFFCFVEEIYL